MRYIDVFNGDADGICALIQLRLADPRDSQLVTGVKRDIALLERVTARAGDQVTVLDISMDKNIAGLTQLLARGATVFYADHHFAGEIPTHHQLTALIDTNPEICTSMLVNRYLSGQFCAWAVVGAFGDNLFAAAEQLAEGLDLGNRLDDLKRLGIYVNYNGYGPSLDDLHFSPAELYNRLSTFADPLEFIDGDRESFNRLETGYNSDMAAAASTESHSEEVHAAVFLLPNKAWARRVSGVFGNDLANQFPGRAHAVVTERSDADYLISVRAPLQNRTGADEICRQFPSGGGRKAAAGVNQLPRNRLDEFVRTFLDYYATDA